jgi:hypothetical protein
LLKSILGNEAAKITSSFHDFFIKKGELPEGQPPGHIVGVEQFKGGENRQSALCLTES